MTNEPNPTPPAVDVRDALALRSDTTSRDAVALIDTLRAQLAALEAERDDAQQELDRLRQEHVMLREFFGEATTRIAELEGAVNEFEASMRRLGASVVLETNAWIALAALTTPPTPGAVEQCSPLHFWPHTADGQRNDEVRCMRPGCGITREVAQQAAARIEAWKKQDATFVIQNKETLECDGAVWQNPPSSAYWESMWQVYPIDSPEARAAVERWLAKEQE